MVVVTVWSRLLIHSFIPGVRTGERECVYILCLARAIEVGAKKEQHMATYESAGVDHGFREKHIQCSIPNPSQGTTSVTHAPVSPRNDTRFDCHSPRTRGGGGHGSVSFVMVVGCGTPKKQNTHTTPVWWGVQSSHVHLENASCVVAHTLWHLSRCAHNTRREDPVVWIGASEQLLLVMRQ